MADTIEALAIARLRATLPNARALPFLESLWTASPSVTVTMELARGSKSTMQSRFYRANLPSAKLYLAATRLVRVRECLDDPSCTIKRVALAMEYSSTPALDRHVKLMTGLTPHEWRKAKTTEQLFDAWFDTLVVPHLDGLRTFDPYATARARKVAHSAKETNRAA